MHRAAGMKQPVGRLRPPAIGGRAVSTGPFDLELLRRHAPTALGAVCVDHEGCPAGLDTKKRLWIKRNENGSLNVFCHNCGSKTYLRHLDSRGSAPPIKTPSKLLTAWEVIMNPEAWPPAARGWFAKYDLEPHQVAASFDPKSERIVLPILRRRGEEEEYAQQMRAIYAHQSPKYLTRGNPNEGHWEAALRGPCAGVVIVEDILSAAKIALQTPFDAVALLRTTISPHIVNIILEHYTSAHVWMDPDEAGWKASTTIANLLNPLIPTHPIFTLRQPKEHSYPEIAEVLDVH